MSGQGYRTRRGHVPPRPLPPRAGSRDGWTTREAPVDTTTIRSDDKEYQISCPTPNRFVRDDPPVWVWAAVMAIAAALIFLLVYLEAFK